MLDYLVRLVEQRLVARPHLTLDALRHIVQEVNSAHDLAEALNVIVTRVKDALQADACSVYLTDYARREQVLMAVAGPSPSAVGELRVDSGLGLIGLVFDRAEPVNVEDVLDHSHHVQCTDAETLLHGFLGVPLIRRRKRKIIGVLIVQQRLPRKYTEDEVSFLVTLATQLAGSLTQAEVRQGLDRLDKDALAGTVFLDGVASARGLGLGEAMVIAPTLELEAVPDRTITDSAAEESRFRQAITAEINELNHLSEQMEPLLSPGDRALFNAYALFLGSDSLVNATLEGIRQGNWAPGALRTTVTEYARLFEEMEDPYLRERAMDIRDLGRRLLKRLHPEPATQRRYPEQVVLVAKEIGISELLEAPLERLAGLVSVHGTGASHVALLARALGIPAVFGVNTIPLNRLSGREVVVDGYTGQVCIQPGPALRQEYLNLVQQQAELVRDLQELRDLPAETPDGHQLGLYANSALFAELATIQDSGAEGMGLYRSEMHFFLRDRFPGEQEQAEIYARVLRSMAPRPVTLRTLDIGGDKSLPYFPIQEENPFLGWRGIRITLDQPDIFKAQLRAMVRAGAAFPNMSILFPMISGTGELREALELLHRAYIEVLDDGWPALFPRVGLMVEVPSAVYQIDNLVQEVDFVSIGTNDLTQYLLAVDRNNERVAKLYDSLHPAVLTAIHHVVERTHLAEKPVSVCGEMAGDPAGALLLMGMGVDILSMSPGNLLKIKWVIRTFTLYQAQELLTEALRLDSGVLVRQRLNAALEQQGLGALVNAGK